MCVDSWQHCTNNWLYFVNCALSSKSSVYSIFILFFLLLHSSPYLALHFFFFAKISSFIKRGTSFQKLGCIFVPEFRIVLWKPSTLVFVLGISSQSTDRLSKEFLKNNFAFKKLYGKCGFISAPLRSSASISSSVVFFKIKNQLGANHIIR